jgi:hypothetical protein
MNTATGVLPGQDDPIYQTGVMLLNGYGYNWYRLDNQLRADDLLIRSRASEHLGAAAARVREIEAAYRRIHLPPPTRERPDPDPEHLAAVRRIRAIADRVAELDTRVRGAAVPANDKVWVRHRDEVGTLWQLTQCDAALIGAAHDLMTLIGERAAPGTIDAAAEQQIDDRLAYIRAALAKRNELLT